MQDATNDILKLLLVGREQALVLFEQDGIRNATLTAEALVPVTPTCL